MEGNVTSNPDKGRNYVFAPLSAEPAKISLFLVGTSWTTLIMDCFTLAGAMSGPHSLHVTFKLEKKQAAVPMLKFELFILLHMEHKSKTKHFCRVFDRGAAPEYNWIAITLAGRNFKFIRKACKDGKLSLCCGLSAGMQCLKALEELHKVRDFQKIF
ncbi:hypothetical protein ANCCAN_03387 [Ancylostoma caninum]|uniref:Uncharacterized protein n=1 Tax=Ancylostoma caninum TaxID=29170 RepID=A0A368H1N7_ANCCA|nr:hypothetical protein ANCCAN_03387 [Ancylostoma caninum]